MSGALRPTYGYELSFGEDSTNGASSVRFEKINDVTYAITCLGLPLCQLNTRDGNDGVELFNLRNEAVGGRLEMSRATVHWENFLSGGSTEFLFEDGRLIRFRRSGNEARCADDLSLLTQRPPSGRLKWLWTKRKDRTKQAGRYWGEGNVRMRLWYANPNAAGVLFAELAVLALAMALFASKTILRLIGYFFLPLPLVLLYLSESRGSFVALCCGAFVLICIAMARKFSPRRFCLFLLLLGGIVTLLSSGVIGDRFGRQLLSDASIGGERLSTWAAVPAMVAAAPQGFGHRMSGRAYCNWFQDRQNHFQQFRLNSTHLTWIVEYGRMFSILYAFAWVTCLGVLIANHSQKGALLAFVELLTLFVGIWFSTVGVCPSLWAIPVIALAFCLRSSVWLHRRTAFLLIGALLCAIGMQLSMESVGRRLLTSLPVSIFRHDGITSVGNGIREVYVVDDEFALARDRLGSFGRDLRGYLAEAGHDMRIAVADSVEILPSSVERLVLIGRSGADYLEYRSRHAADASYCRARETVFLSPPFPPKAIPNSLLMSSNVRIVIGEFAAELDSGYGNPPPFVNVVPHTGLYLPLWPRYAFDPWTGS